MSAGDGGLVLEISKLIICSLTMQSSVEPVASSVE